MTVELLLCVPAMMICLIAVIEFGMYFTSLQSVALAARIGARQAARTAGPLPATGSAAPASVQAPVLRHLAACNITPSQIVLDQSVDSPVVGLPDRSVRVRVVVPFTQMMPNALTSFGFNVSGYTSQKATTFAYEL